MFKRSVLLVAALTLFAMSPAVFAAQDSAPEPKSESILLSPTDKRYELDAGAEINDSFKVVNDGNTAFNFVTYARPYSVSSENYTPDFTSEAQNADAYRWIQFEETSYYVEPGKTIDVKYSLRVPRNATPGGHYGVLFAETQPVDTKEGTSVLRAKRVGAIMYVTVKGDTKLSGKVEGVDVPLLQFKAPLQVRQRVSNAGNTDFVVNANVRVYDLFGNLKMKSDKEAAVLPGTTRSIVNDWTNPAWMGVYKVEQQAKFLDTTKMTTSYVVLVPLWVYLVIFVLIGGRVIYGLARRSSKK